MSIRFTEHDAREIVLSAKLRVMGHFIDLEINGQTVLVLTADGERVTAETPGLFDRRLCEVLGIAAGESLPVGAKA